VEQSAVSGALWTEEREAQLRKLHALRLTPGQMAVKIGVTRNAVIGKINRLGLSNTRERPQQTASQKLHLKIRGASGAFGIGVEAASSVPLPSMPNGSDIPIAQRRTLLELNSTVCKWPFGEPSSPDFFFCGGDAIEGKPYCAGHCRVAYRDRTA
jgi:GcrA cell cycle regulator